MHQIEHFELATPHAVALKLDAGCVIRVTGGRLWLTVQDHLADVWLHAGEGWMLPVSGTVWLSAEGTAQFQLSRAVRQGWWSSLERIMHSLSPSAGLQLQAATAN
jgi:hypothetical protein